MNECEGMKKHILITKGLSILVFLIFFSSLNVNTAYAQSITINDGLLWLSNNQNPDGSWGLQGNLTLINTTEVMDTLRYLGYTGTSYTEGVNWVSSYTATSTDEIARATISLNTDGLSVTTSIDILTGYINPDNGWGIGESFSSDIVDTALALDALKSVNYSNQATISNAVLYLITNQNSDGGWGFYAGDDSNVYMTAMVSSTLEQFQGSGQGQALPLQEAIKYITKTQFSDGSWNEDAYSIAHKKIFLTLNILFVNPYIIRRVNEDRFS